MKKRLLSLLLVLVLSTALLAAGATNEVVDNLVTSGTCGANATWRFDGDTGTLYIEGSGAMEDYSNEWDAKLTPWNQVRDLIARVEVAEGITHIGNEAFGSVFWGGIVPYLTEVSLPSTLQSIGSLAFANTALEEITLPDSLVSLGESALIATHLTQVNIGPNVAEMGVNPFEAAPISTLTVSSGNRNFVAEDNVLYTTGKTQIVCYPAGNTMTQYAIPATVTGEVEFSDFWGAAALRSISVPASVTVVCDYIPADGMLAYEDESQTFTVYFAGAVPDVSQWNYWSGEVLMSVTASSTGAPPIVPADPLVGPFTDVKQSDYFAQAVLWALEYNVTSGTSATTFGPGASCTRAQVVTFLWRAAGEPEPISTQSPFTDISTSDYFYKAVLWAAEEGIASGLSETTFGPSANVTRGQSVTFLWRFAGRNQATSGNPFVDVIEDAYYYDAVLWAAESGVTSGTSATTFAPDANCNRGQIVTFLWRIMGNA